MDFPASDFFKPWVGKKIVRGDSEKQAYFSSWSVLNINDKVPRKEALWIPVKLPGDANGN